MAPILLESIAEALARIDTHKLNKCHAPFLGNYSITSKLTRVCECNIVLGQHRNNYMFINVYHTIDYPVFFIFLMCYSFFPVFSSSPPTNSSLWGCGLVNVLCPRSPSFFGSLILRS